MSYRVCLHTSRGSMGLYTHAPVARHVCIEGCARSRASESLQQGNYVGRQGFRPNPPPCPNPGGPPVAARAGLRPAAARVPAGGTAAAAADCPAQPAGRAPATQALRPHCPGQSRSIRPPDPRRGEHPCKDRCAGVCRWGWGRLQDLPLKGAPSPEDPVVACGLQGLGSFPDPRGGVPARPPGVSICAAPVPGGFGVSLPQVGSPWGPPHRPCRTVSGTARQQIPGCPGSRPGPCARRRLSQLPVVRGCPLQRLPSPPGPDPATEGLQVWAILTGRWA